MCLPLAWQGEIGVSVMEDVMIVTEIIVLPIPP